MFPSRVPCIIVTLCLVSKSVLGFGDVQYVEIPFPNQPYNLSCKTNGLDMTGRTISWFQNKKRISTSENFVLEDKEQILKLVPAKLKDEGLFLCQISESNVLVVSKEIYVKFYEPPKVSNTNLKNNLVEIDVSTVPFKLYCNVTGIPKPSIQWFKDGTKLESTQTMNFKYEDVVLEFTELKPDDAGSYRCVISNVVGTIFAEAILKLNTIEGMSSKAKIIILSLSCVGGLGSAGALGFLGWKYWCRCTATIRESYEEAMEKLKT